MCVCVYVYIYSTYVDVYKNIYMQLYVHAYINIYKNIHHSQHYKNFLLSDNYMKKYFCNTPNLEVESFITSCGKLKMILQ